MLYFWCCILWILSQYRNIKCCNIKHQVLVSQFRHRHALTKEEKSNHVHAQLRNGIEGVQSVLTTIF